MGFWTIQRKSQRMPLMPVGILAGVFIFFSVVACPLYAQETTQTEKTEPFFCLFVSDGGVSYRTGLGPWLGQQAGTCPVVLPLYVKNRTGKCQIQIDPNTLLEALPSSEFDLQSTKLGGLVLSLTKGSVLYSKPDNVRLSIVVPSQSFVVQAGRSEANEIKEILKDRALDIGIVQVPEEKDSKIEVANIRGLVSVIKGEDLSQEVPVGETLSIDISGSGFPGSFSIKPFQVDTGAASPPYSPILSTTSGESKSSFLVPVKTAAWRVVETSEGAFVESARGVGYLRPQSAQGRNMNWDWCDVHGQYHPFGH